MTDALAREPQFLGWRMVAVCFIILNVALGMNFTGYGALVSAVRVEFNTSTALASAGVSMLTLSMGLMSPIVGGLMRRFPLKLLMIVGVLLNAAGLAVISQTHDIYVLLASYFFLVGTGFCLYAIIPCTAIISNWFVVDRGKAIGIINIPIGNAVMPVAAASAMTAFGLSATFAAGAIILLVLVPLILLVVDDPLKVGQQAKGAGSVEEPGAGEPALAAGQIVRSSAFVVLTLAVAVLSAAGLVMVTHTVGLAMGRGLSLDSASLLLGGFGLAGVLGAPVFGWLSDKFGGGKAFAILAFLMIPGWLGLLVAQTFLPLLILATLIGICSNGIVTLFGSTTGEWFGSRNVGLVMGLCYLFQIPFLFGAPPLAGAMYEATGSYQSTIFLHVASMVAIGLLMLLYKPRRIET